MLSLVAAILLSAIVAATHQPAVPPAPADPAVERALRTLQAVGFPLPVLPVIVVDGTGGPGIRTGMATFRLRDRQTGKLEPRIYVNSASVMYRLALEQDSVAVAMLAASLVHEVAHGDGGGEARAYRSEARFLRAYLARQPLSARDRAQVEFNLVNVQNLERIEAHRERRQPRPSRDGR